MSAGALLIARFVIYAVRTRRSPLIDVPLRPAQFGLSGTITFVAGFSSFAAMFLLPMFYQVVRGESAFATGVLLIPLGRGIITFDCSAGASPSVSRPSSSSPTGSG